MLTLGIIAAIVVFLIVSSVYGKRKARDFVEHAYQTTGQVVALSQVTSSDNGNPYIRMTVHLDAGSSSRDVVIEQAVSVVNMPRVGDMVTLAADLRDANKLVYQGPVPTAPLRSLHASVPISPEMVGNRNLGVGVVHSIKGTAIEVMLDSVVDKPHLIQAVQTVQDQTVQTGLRVYVYLHSNVPNQAALVPLADTGGHPFQDSRLDMLVLAPQLRAQGRRATGKVLESRQMPTGANFARLAGRETWFVRMTVTPADGGPVFEATQTSNMPHEKAMRICAVGAEVPLRLDWNDPTVFLADSAALGYPEPSLAGVQAWNDAVAKGQADQP